MVRETHGVRRLARAAVPLEPKIILGMRPWIRRFARWMGLEKRFVDDVVQDVVIEAWRRSSAGLYRPPHDKPADRALLAWLHGITWRTAWPYVCKAGPRREVPCGLRIAPTVKAGR